jgi:hypothetical protein
MRRRLSLLPALLAATLGGLIVSARPAAALATITVINNDGPGEGFNDPAPFTPVGGNPATTLGQARLAAFRYAALIWGSYLNSSVEIQISARMDPLSGNATTAVLGQAGSATVHRNFPNAPLANTWYSQALANALANADLDPATPDITARFNSAIDGPILGTTDWYYGFDGNPGANVDFVSVVLHELAHGLGFQTFANTADGSKLSGLDDTYLKHLECHGANPPAYGERTDAQRVACSISDPNLHWVGSHTLSAAVTLPLTAGFSGGHVQMNAPNPLQPGSSVSHFSTAAFPNQLMEPTYTGANHSVGLALRLLQDIGWSLQARVCVPSDTVLCLNQGRFIVEADWRTSTGRSALAHAIPLTADTGYFWFFDAANVEVVTKVLDACSINARYWVFSAGLTNVEVVLRVTDTETGIVRAYTNPQGTAYNPQQDANAFATCP